MAVAVCIPWARLSSINTALFPCQEPPVAMSTWQARARAPCDYTVLMSGENQDFAKPAETVCLWTTTISNMFVPTWIIPVGTMVIPHRVFAPPCHLQKSNGMVLPLLPLYLTAAHSILGVHPFSRLDVLIVSSGFSSLGMARPSKENTGEVSESVASVVKHALNPEKPYMQVHYLKGYFLLKFLADQLGEEKFLHFFKVFVGKFHGQLNLSQDFLWTLLDTFLALSRQGIALESIFSDWLDIPEMPKWLRDACSEWLRTPAVQEVKGEVAKWIHFSGSGGKGSKQKRAGPKVNFKELSPEQLVFLLEFLLEEPKLSLSTLRLLQTTNNLQAQDAEVKHRWSELVVKYKHTAA